MLPRSYLGLLDTRHCQVFNPGSLYLNALIGRLGIPPAEGPPLQWTLLFIVFMLLIERVLVLIERRLFRWRTWEKTA